MVSSTALAFSTASLLFSLPVNAGLYPKSSAVLQVDAKSYDRLIAKSNHTSIVEFYAPWCGHCKNLQPAYERVAKTLSGLAKVAAVDCDDDANKAFCGSMGVQGFPTLKIVRPGKKAGKPLVEDYQGARSAKAIADAVVDKIPYHVTRVTDKSLDDWLSLGNETAKAVLFSDKGTTSALLRSLAIDYLGSVSFAQIRDKESTAVSTFGITKYPTFVVLPGGSKDSIVYEGELKKSPMSEFISKSSGLSPNPDPAPEAPKKKDTKTKKDDKKSSKSAKASDSHKAADASSEKDEKPAECPHAKGAKNSAPPAEVKDEAPMIKTLEKDTDLQRECLSTKSHICILALLPTKKGKDALLPEDATQALLSLSEVHHKHSKRHSIFPFYSIPAENELGQKVRETLGFKTDGRIELIAVNAKRSWYRHFPGTSFGNKNVEDWVDAIKMNEGKREKLPETLVKESPEEEDVEPEPVAEAAPPKAEEQAKPEATAQEDDEVEEDAPKEAPKVVTEGPIVIEDLGPVEETPEPVKEKDRDEL